MARGSITPRPMKDGKVRYRVKWETRGPDGKRIHHSATKSTKKEAEKFLAKQLTDVEAGTFVVPTKETVGDFLQRWIEVSSPNWGETTIYQYDTIMRCRILPHLGGIQLARLDELTIQGCYAKLIAQGYSGYSVAAAHSVLDSALSQAVAWRILPRNPADGVRVPTPTAKAPKVWSLEEATAFIESTAADRLSPLWRLGLDSGMRLGEMLALAWTDVDLDGGVVAVRRTLTRTRSGTWKIGDLAKTTSSRRSIVLGPSTVAALRGHRARQAERRLLCGAAWMDLGLVFDRGTGQWLDPDVVRDAFQRAVRQARLPRLTPHGMRHTMATLLLAAGVHPKIVQERLGHKSIQMTLDRYSHVSRTMQQDAAQVLERLLGDGARPNRGQEAG